MRVLYLSYDGALDPLGASQVLPYVQGLSARGHTFDLLTFEKPERWRSPGRSDALGARLESHRIAWHPLAYHKRPSAAATAWDLHAGFRKARALHLAEPFDLVHVRSYPCALIALALKRSYGVPFLFDIRGFYPEERVDGGIWDSKGPLYTLAKRLERDFFREAQGVVTLTQASVRPLQALLNTVGSNAELTVIPTATDLERFQTTPSSRPERIVYLGSVGTWYRIDSMVALARNWVALDPTLIVDFLINGDSRELVESVRTLPGNRVRVRSVTHEEVPGALAGALATFAVIDPAPSKVASAPTKIGESLAAGLPVLANRGVGDVASWIEQADIGVVLDALTPEAYAVAAPLLLAKAREPDIAARCRAFAERHLSLDLAVDRYETMYRAMTMRPKGRSS